MISCKGPGQPKKNTEGFGRAQTADSLPCLALCMSHLVASPLEPLVNIKKNMGSERLSDWPTITQPE